MATVINNPPATQQSEGSIIGPIFLVLAIVLFTMLLFAVVVPALRSGSGPSSGDSSVNVPERVDVNVQTPQ